ncbi:hypothetical protein ABMC88_14955 [Sulfitobacter sp. HNIBRBA2951]|uniref:hypothetical protein n=1 Tax=Sulfitobacter aquimarinus TaxID=3158557 RepID=UPI0032E039B0
MAEQEPSQTPAQKAKAAEAARKQERLRAALKSNMARRKTQARARNAQADTDEGPHTRSATQAPHKDT